MLPHYTHIHLMALCPGLPGWAGTWKVKPICILLKQETVNGSGISWAICKSAPCTRQTTMPAPHHSVFYRPDALSAAQPTVSKHWRQNTTSWNINVRQQAINDRLQGSVATYIRCGRVVNNEIKKGLSLSLPVKKFLKSVNTWQSYKQEDGCLVHFYPPLAVWWPGAQSKQPHLVHRCPGICRTGVVNKLRCQRCCWQRHQLAMAKFSKSRV